VLYKYLANCVDSKTADTQQTPIEVENSSI
jgi:hypothetical protein